MKFEDFNMIRESDHFTAFEVNDLRTLVDRMDLCEILLLNGYQIIFKTHIINDLYMIVCKDLQKPDPEYKGVERWQK